MPGYQAYPTIGQIQVARQQARQEKNISSCSACLCLGPQRERGHAEPLQRNIVKKRESPPHI